MKLKGKLKQRYRLTTDRQRCITQKSKPQFYGNSKEKAEQRMHSQGEQHDQCWNPRKS